MDLLPLILAVLGLSLFEIISSVDNAVINAEVLSTMKPASRKWFLFWGIIFAVFVVRGLLPLVIVWLFNPSLGLWGAFTATFSNDHRAAESLERSAPLLLMGGGVFLVFVFFNWLFLESKHYGFFGERFFFSQGIWFYAVVSALLSVIVWHAIGINPVMAFAAVVGSTAFFLTHGFKQQAELAEKKLKDKSGRMSDISKILYLEVIDTTFSIDGVLGAFAFTFSVPLILIGNGLGAIVLRQLTIAGVDRIKKYIFLKNGAMYSIFFLGSIMILESFGMDIPHWISPLVTVITVSYFFLKSKKVNLKDFQLE